MAKIVKKVAKTAPKAAAKTETAKKTAKVAKKDLANITNCEDFFCMIRDRYNAVNEKNITKEDVSKVWKAFQNAFADFSKDSDSEKATVLLPDIGVLTVFVSPERESINPRTQEKITVAAKKRVRFRAYPRFVDKINGVEKKKSTLTTLRLGTRTATR
jgi:nucleoid DNA-binding protein